MAGVVGAVEGEVARRLELSLDPIEPGRVGRGVGELDVVGLGPVGDAMVGLGRQVGAEVVHDESDPDVRWVERSQVAGESQELGTVLGRGHVPVEVVGRQVVAGQEVADAVGAGVSGTPATASGLLG